MNDKDSATQENNRITAMHPLLGSLFRFFRWGLAFSGLYAMFAVCPFCGRVGCPVGAGSAGLVGGFFALCIQVWETLKRTFLKSRVQMLAEELAEFQRRIKDLERKD
ncbi:MAG: hypothetical protein AB1487_11050 [Thermodesulfobacteriota bacterium]